MVEIRLLAVYVRGGVASAMPELGASPKDQDAAKKDDDVLAFAY